MNKLPGALIGLARAAEGKELLPEAREAMLLGLSCYSKRASVSGSQEDCTELISKLHSAKRLMAPDCASCQCSCGRTDDYDMEELFHSSDLLKEAKLKLLDRLGAIAVRLTDEKDCSPKDSAKLTAFLAKSLFLIGCTYEASQLSDSLEQAVQYLI